MGKRQPLLAKWRFRRFSVRVLYIYILDQSCWSVALWNCSKCSNFSEFLLRLYHDYFFQGGRCWHSTQDSNHDNHKKKVRARMNLDDTFFEMSEKMALAYQSCISDKIAYRRMMHIAYLAYWSPNGNLLCTNMWTLSCFGEEFINIYIKCYLSF